MSTNRASLSARMESMEPRRLMAAGDLDTTFHKTGSVAAYFDSGNAPAGAGGAAAFQADGKLLMTEQRKVGSATRIGLIRDNDNGTLDKTFAGGGISMPGTISQILPQADGNIVVIGKTSTGGYIQRFDSSGNVIGFAAITANTSFGVSLAAVAQAADGGYYVGGVFVNKSTGKNAPAVIRLSADGSFDTSFGKNGVLYLTVGGQPATIAQLAVLSTGDVAVAGTTVNGNVTSAAYAIRISDTGTLINTDAAANNASTIAGLAATADGRSVFQLSTVFPFSATVRTTSSTGSSIGNLFGASTAAEVTGAGGGIAAGGYSIVSATLTGKSNRSITLTQMDGAGATANFQRTYTFGSGAAKVDAMRVIGNKLLMAVYDAGTGTEKIVRVDLDPTRASGTATIGGIVYEDANGNALRDTSETGAAGRVVYVDANNDGKFEAPENNAVTDASGFYEIKNLADRTYTIRDVLPSGVKQTSAASQSIAVTAQGTFKFIKDFGTQDGNAPKKGSPAAPTKSAATVVTTPQKAVSLTWGDAANNESGYLIQRRYRGESGWNTIATLSAGTTSYQDAVILNNVAYDYRIVAYNDVAEIAGAVLQLHT